MQSKLKLKLPTVMPDGTRTTLHPFIWCLENGRNPFPSTRALAHHLGIRSQSVQCWKAECHADRNFLLPADRVMALAALFRVGYRMFRPEWPEVKP